MVLLDSLPPKHSSQPLQKIKMEQKIRIGFLSEVDLKDVTRLSGTSYHIRRVLEEKGFEVVCLDRLEEGFHWRIFLKKVKARLGRSLMGKKYPPWWTMAGARVLAARAQKMIKKHQPDILFSWSTPIFSQLKSDIPKLLFTDATFHLLVDFYENYTGLGKSALMDGEGLAFQAFYNADRLLFSSHWAAESAINDYLVPAEKVHVVTLGANLEISHDEDFIMSLVRKKKKDRIHLLFMGVDWKRKGGDKAIAIAGQLKELGFEVILHVAGSVPPAETPIPSFVQLHGFISKGSPEGRKALEDLFSMVHFLVLPTIADCTPMVYAELNAYGIPAVTHLVGGVETVVKHEKNGLLFETGSTSLEIAEGIAFCLREPNHYEKLALTSFKSFRDKLNWDVTAEQLANHIKSLYYSKKKGL